MKRVLDRALDWIDQKRPMEPVGLFRIVVGAMILLHITAFFRARDNEFYRDSFYLPYWDWLPEPSSFLYSLLLWGIVVCGIAIILGPRNRIVFPVTFVLMAYHLFLNMIWYRHNRYLMILSLFWLCFMARDPLVLFSRRVSENAQYYWPMFMVRVQLSLAYLASGASKFLDPDWSGGSVLWLRYGQEPGQLPLWKFMSLAAISTEWAIGIGMWIPGVRYLVVWIGLCFHGYIEYRFNVLVFSYLTLGTYLLLISPHQQNRVFYFNPDSSWQQQVARWVRSLDWLGKIRLIPVQSKTIYVTDPKGTTYRGLFAVILAARAILLTFFFAYPLTLLRFFRWAKADLNPETLQEVPMGRPLQSPGLWDSGLNVVTLLLGLTLLVLLARILEPEDLEIIKFKFFILPALLIFFGVAVLVKRQKLNGNFG